MPNEPSGVGVWSPKIADQSLVRKFVSLNGEGYVAISIQKGTEAVDPDPDTLAIAVWFRDVLSGTVPSNPYGAQVLTVSASEITRADTGKYHYDLGPALTANRGLLTVIWTYQVDGMPFQFTDHLQVLEPMPTYDTLTDTEKYMVEQVTWMFGDLYDSSEGGPHLIEEFQTHWGYERIAQLLSIAVQKMNYIGNFGNAPTTWAIGNGGTPGLTIPGETITKTQVMPDGSSTSVTYSTQSSTIGASGGMPANMYGLAIWAAYIEVIRHLRDSYTEIPARPGMDAVYVDRRDYWQRWNTTLQQEEQNFKTALTQAKLSEIGMSRGSLLVAGGIYGGSAMGYFQYGTYAAQTRSFRFYPAAPAIMFPAVSR